MLFGFDEKAGTKFIGNGMMAPAFTLNTTQLTRGHTFKLSTNRCNLELRRHFFTNRCSKSVEFPTKSCCAYTDHELFKSKLNN